MGRYFNDFANDDHLEHYGRKGMKWGKNIYNKEAIDDPQASYSEKRRSVKEHNRRFLAARSAAIDPQFITSRYDINDPNDTIYNRGGRRSRANWNSEGSIERTSKRKQEEARLDKLAKQTNSKILNNATAANEKKKAQQQILNKMLNDLNSKNTSKEKMQYINSLSEEEQAMLLSVLKNKKGE